MISFLMRKLRNTFGNKQDKSTKELASLPTATASTSFGELDDVSVPDQGRPRVGAYFAFKQNRFPTVQLLDRRLLDEHRCPLPGKQFIKDVQRAVASTGIVNIDKHVKSNRVEVNTSTDKIYEHDLDGYIISWNLIKKHSTHDNTGLHNFLRIVIMCL